MVEEAHLGLFSFTKFLMWLDLEARRDALLQSNVVHHLALGARESFPDQGPFPQPERLDAEHMQETINVLAFQLIIAVHICC